MVRQMTMKPVHTVDAVARILAGIPDPEIPVISIVDLGIVRSIVICDDSVVVTITPTYSGCPAMRTIEEDIRASLKEAGYANVTVQTVLSPSWTTDWLSVDARKRLREYGIAPPNPAGDHSPLLSIQLPVIPCPYCHSQDTLQKTEFGSTACKAYYFCHGCRQPFEYLKPL